MSLIKFPYSMTAVPLCQGKGAFRALALLWLALLFQLPTLANDAFPAWYEATTPLNMRTTPSGKGRVAYTVEDGTRVLVLEKSTGKWARVVCGEDTMYCAKRYLRYAKPFSPQAEKAAKARQKKGFWGKVRSILWNILWVCVVLYVLRWVIIYGSLLISRLVYKVYWVACAPFYLLNWLQRYAAKPWRWDYKHNRGNDRRNRQLREKLRWAKLPLYVLLTPLRLVNAVYYNLFVHCLFEMMNYTLEVVDPTSPREGADDTPRWLLFLPWRVLKYPLWHGSLTLVESCVWTVVDTFVPALTLFHGTDRAASESITQSRGRVGNHSRYTEIWNVGGGNYAGNGIYFAPARSTALHYAAGSLIVCRVTLGRVLDLGLAPKRIYDECGHPDALNVTRWGLEHDYVTGEWWRADEKWWEYCMYDWQNRYNYSWRIRPLYVLSLDDETLQRTPGGIHHWLFRRMVMADMVTWARHVWKKKKIF